MHARSRSSTAIEGGRLARLRTAATTGHDRTTSGSRWPGTVTLDPNEDQCKVRGKLKGNRAVLEASSCSSKQGGGVAELQFTGGSFELRDGELALEVTATLKLTVRGKHEQGTVTWKATLKR